MTYTRRLKFPTCWSFGLVFGPVIGGFLAPAMGWRWTIWIFTFLCVAVLLTMFFFLPETSASHILYNRAKSLRAATGNACLKSQTEIDTTHYTSRDNLLLLGKAFTLTFSEPIILLVDLYAGLLYVVLFVWFESLPIVFGGMYGFGVGSQGLVFLGILVFTAITMSAFLFWINRRLVPAMKSARFRPEMFLPPTFIGCFALPICLFWFGWSARESVRWIVPPSAAASLPSASSHSSMMSTPTLASFMHPTLPQSSLAPLCSGLRSAVHFRSL